MAVTRLPAVDPAEVRAAAGFNASATWYSPRKHRPAAFKAMDNQPTSEDGRVFSFEERA
jgi:hypothetical protein